MPEKTSPPCKPLYWIGSSRKDMQALPDEVKSVFGRALRVAQFGGKADAAKVLQGFGGAGVLEVVENDAAGTYRAVYTVRFAHWVFVLHCFQKKSKQASLRPRPIWTSFAAGSKWPRRWQRS